MKKINQKVWAIAVFACITILQTACSFINENTSTQCELSKEFKGHKFSVYYMDQTTPILKGDLTISENLESWQFRDDCDFEKREVGQLFTDFEGSLKIQNENHCKTGDYTLLFEDLSEIKAFKLVKHSIDSGFNEPIYSYDFEVINPQNNSKEHYRFNKE